MPRTIVDIPAEQMAAVDRLCQAQGISRAEAVRRALRAYVQGEAEVRVSGFGLWAAAAGDGAAGPRPPATEPRRKAKR